MKKNLKGFTLVEVLIVIIIIGILIAALLPRLVGTQARARDTARNGHITQIAQAVALMKADNVALPAGSVAATGGLVTSAYLSSVPVDPIATTESSAGVTAPNYTLYTTGGVTTVIANVEGDKGNCSVPSAPTATPAIVSTQDGTHSCVVVQ